MKKLLISFVFFVSIIEGYTQPWFPKRGEVFDDAILPRVDITIHPDSLQWLYDNEYASHEFKARFIYTTDNDSDTITDVGFRLRGNTSRASDKKSFKISFNTFKQGRKYNGLEKMNLNGEHNDPSVIRSYLVWNIFEQCRVPGSRSNHVIVYINGDYYGLYINVEHVDEEFVERRFGNKLGNLYKCTRRVGLDYISEDKEDYKNTGYDLKTNTDKDDYSDLINFIKTINNTSSQKMPEDIEPIFNINGFIRYLVVEIFTGHWDAYSVNSNNYYLYNNAYTGKFEFIPYDVDNTFGIDWFGVDWATRDIYRWWNDWEDKVLTSKTFGNQVYKDRFSFLLNQLIENYLNEDNLFPIIDNTYTKIKNAAKDDPFRPLDYGWDYSDFTNSYTQALSSNHVTYGLKPYITARLNSIQAQIELNPIAPIVENVYHNFPLIEQPIKIKADVTDDQANPEVKLYYNIGGNWQSVSMNSSDLMTYEAELQGVNKSTQIKYYIEATDASGKKTREPYQGDYKIHIGSSEAMLVINEFMASNQGVILDNYGESEDWIEILNNGTNPVSLKGKYLTDDLSDPTRWNLPDVVLQPGEYYIVWADNDAEQGENHTNFKLGSSGESIGLFDSFENSYAAIDTLNYGEQMPDYSEGLNNTGSYDLQNVITPMAENGNADYAFLTVEYNMNRQIDDGAFDPETGFIDIVGSFNNFEGSFAIYDGNNDGVYAATIMSLQGGTELNYRARMNNSEIEFENMGSDADRSISLVGGQNMVSHWFNDQVAGNSNELMTNQSYVYPNPVNGANFTLTTETEIKNITIYSASGQLVYQNNIINSKNVQLENTFTAGLYYVMINTKSRKIVEKMIVN